MKLYKKKNGEITDIVKAVQFTGLNLEEMIQASGCNEIIQYMMNPSIDLCFEAQDDLRLLKGDFLVKDGDNSLWVADGGWFEEDYVRMFAGEVPVDGESSC